MTMARKQYNSNASSIVDDLFEEASTVKDDIKMSEEPTTTPTPKNVDKATGEIKSETSPKKTDKKAPNKKRRKVAASKPFTFSKAKEDSVTRSFRVERHVSEAIDEIVMGENGKKIEGSRGFIKTLINNALIKELVELGVLDRNQLNKITSYDDL